MRLSTLSFACRSWSFTVLWTAYSSIFTSFYYAVWSFLIILSEFFVYLGTSLWLGVQFSCSAVSDSLQPHGLQHARPPCPSPTPRACSNSCPSSWWCHPSISSSVIPFSSCLQSFPASGSFPMSQSSHQVAKILKFHLQHQSLQLIFRDDFT